MYQFISWSFFIRILGEIDKKFKGGLYIDNESRVQVLKESLKNGGVVSEIKNYNFLWHVLGENIMV